MASVTPIPGTYFEWDDQSAITQNSVAVTNPMPLYCAVFTSDKGKEDWQVLDGQDWFNMYAVNNVVEFSRHGQPLLQAAASINAGAQLLCKRVVADDACLANIAVVANVSTTEVQKTNAEGEPLYADPDGKETTSADGNTPIMESKTTIKFSYRSASGCATKKEVIDTIKQDVEDNAPIDGSTDYLLWVIFDNGRGESKKRIRITPNYQLSKNYENYFLYDMTVIEAGRAFPTVHFCLNPDIVSENTNLSFQYRVNAESNQVEAYQFDDNISAYMDAIIGATGLETADAMGLDLLFGRNKKGKAIEGFTLDTDGGVDIQISTGQLLLNGDNGSFGDKPLEAESYAPLLAKALAGYVINDDDEPTILTVKDGCYDPVIYNVDRYKIDAIIDANYPALVKRAAEQLVTFREDCMFFRDMGTGVSNMELIRLADENNLHNCFCSTYCTYYDIIDPYTRKQITVTMTYHLAQLMVQQFNNGRNRPMAGIKYGFTINDIIEDSIGFTPTICPDLNEKEDLYDMKINYATYIDNELVIESIYTSQQKYSQLSFSNNVLAVQQVIKVIRTRCPALRYTFIDGDDLSKYRADVDKIIDPYRANFKYLGLTYLEDPYYTQNKIFYASLAFQFRDFVQTEYFKITALSSTAEVE